MYTHVDDLDSAFLTQTKYLDIVKDETQRPQAAFFPPEALQIDF